MQSVSGSAASSRHQTPVANESKPISRSASMLKLEKQLAKQMMLLENKYVLVGLIFASIILTIICLSSVRQSSFCDTGKYGFLCTSCPENGVCQANTLQCPENFLKTNRQCLEIPEGVNESIISALHKEIKQIYKQGKRNIDDFSMEVSYSDEKSFLAAIAYDDEFVIRTIRNSSYVLRRPVDMDPFITTVLLCMSLVGLMGAIEVRWNKNMNINV